MNARQSRNNHFLVICIVQSDVGGVRRPPGACCRDSASQRLRISGLLWYAMTIFRLDPTTRIVKNSMKKQWKAVNSEMYEQFS